MYIFALSEAVWLLTEALSDRKGEVGGASRMLAGEPWWITPPKSSKNTDTTIKSISQSGN